MLDNYTEICVKAHHTELAQVHGWLTEQLQGLQIPEAMITKVQLVVEELFTNSIYHAYRLECDQPIRVGYAWHSPQIHILYADQAPGFDLRTATPTPAKDGIGGNGLLLIQELASHLDYSYSQGWNRIGLVFAVA